MTAGIARAMCSRSPSNFQQAIITAHYEEWSIVEACIAVLYLYPALRSNNNNNEINTYLTRYHLKLVDFSENIERGKSFSCFSPSCQPAAASLGVKQHPTGVHLPTTSNYLPLP